MTTKKMFAILCVSLVVAGCGEGDDSAKEQAMREAAAREADAARKALVANRREVVEELQGDNVSPERREALEGEERRLAREIGISNNERLRRDQEEVRRQISEKKRGGT